MPVFLDKDFRIWPSVILNAFLSVGQKYYLKILSSKSYRPKNAGFLMLLPFGTPSSSYQNTLSGPLFPTGKAIGHPERIIPANLW